MEDFSTKLGSISHSPFHHLFRQKYYESLLFPLNIDKFKNKKRQTSLVDICTDFCPRVGSDVMNAALRVLHGLYGEGEIVTMPNKDGMITVAFQKEQEVVIGKVIDTDHYYENGRRLEKTSFIEVHQSELKILGKNSFLNYKSK